MKLRQERRRDEGFTLIEVVVSMLIFAVLSSAVVGLVVKTLQTTTKADNKSAASNLADAKKEYLIGTDWDSVVSGSNTVDADGDPWTNATQGVQYTVKTTVALVPNSDSFCSTNGAELTRKLIRVDVSWPGMGSTDAVTNSTFRRVYQSDSASQPGAAAWQVNTPGFSPTGAVSYAGLSGLTASAYDSSTGALAATGVTDSNGCVVMSNLDAGKYSVIVNQADYVGQDNKQQQSTDVTVQAGKISVPDPLRYAPVSSAKLKLVQVAGYNPPSSLASWTGFSSTLYADTISGYDQRSACVGAASALSTPCLGSDGTIGRLYPKAYSGWLGLCADVNAASTKATSGDFTPRWTAADVPTVNVQLGSAAYQLTSILTTQTWAVTATYTNPTASCTGQTISLGNASSNSAYKVGLPLGTWTITATSATGKVSSKNVTVTSSSAPVVTSLAVTL
ncbi:prepilin-type N-terminal cleavage/methylation domain-containing protein [Kineococcus sp. NBC_00420]|uniref:type IV pilus modification PilV family protein n=1 Tax=Kineococcus sp. NBC_00420 TaxID=2903564 RepID=UPI002E242CBF